MTFHTVYVLVIIKLLSTYSTNGLVTNETDQSSLIAFKSSINDPQNALQSWNSSIHFCQWEGVQCNNNQERVTRLILFSKGLEGNLTSSIGNLSFLEVLHLANNKFQGLIPSSLSKLFRLRYLNLQYNSFEGEIDLNISGWVDLSSLVISYNSLVGKIPHEITLLKKIQYLDLCNNYLTGEIPNSIGNLSSLTYFSVESNLLSGNIPDSIGLLTNLTTLSLGNNTLSGTIPYSIYNLSSLNMFSIYSNQIGGTLDPNIGLMLPQLTTLNVAETYLTGSIPHSLSNATKLETIYMYSCSFTGKVEVDFSHLKNLTYLVLWGNSLGGEEPDTINFLSSLSNSSNLVVLDIQTNKFRGSLPDYMGNFSNTFFYLSVSENYLTGHIPSWITNLSNLSSLFLDHNEFSGSIPNDIGKLSQLQRLDLSNNVLTGKMPSSIGNLSLLNQLDLNSNRLEGEVESSLGNCQKLIELDLSVNNFSGDIPKEIFQISSLAVLLNLSHNRFSGELPAEVKNLGQLSVFDMSNNAMSGEIPSSISSCTSLQSLNLSHNSFQGSIPDSMQSMRGLKYLDLSQNRLSGKIPIFLGNLSLRDLNLSSNDFEGEIPDGGIFSDAKAVSFSGNSRLCGAIDPLPRCRKENKDKSSLIIVIIVLSCSAFVGLAAVLALVILFLKKRKKGNFQSKAIEPSFTDSSLKLSYGILHKATEGFSSKNLLGQGSFGTVYKGLLPNGNELIAVKVLNVEEQGVSTSFHAECNALSKLRHRNLVKILFACSSLDFQRQDFKALVYNFFPNGNLERWIHPCGDDIGQTVYKSLSLLERINIALDIAFAIDYLQNECPTLVVHCDIKPSNVLLDENMVAHLGDFGLAKIISDQDFQYQSSCRSLRGTIGYAAPEYGLGGEVSKKGDIYSFGILLLELVTGKRPTDTIFEGNLNLNKFGKMGIVDNVMEIVDPNLVRIEDEQAKSTTQSQVVVYKTSWKEKTDSIIRMTMVAVACSMENPQDRSDIRTAINELKIARDNLLCNSREIVLSIND